MFSPCFVVPSFHSYSFRFFPPYIPPRLRLCVSVLWMLHRAPLAALLSVNHQARPPPFVLPSVKFSFRCARRCAYFVPFCRFLSCPAYSLHAAVSARRHTQRKQAYLRSYAPCITSSVSIFCTLKKKFRSLQKKTYKKTCTFQKYLLPLHT